MVLFDLHVFVRFMYLLVHVCTIWHTHLSLSFHILETWQTVKACPNGVGQNPEP